MKKTAVKYKKPIVAGVIILVIFLGYFYRDKWMGMFKSEDAPTDTSSTKTSSTSNSSSSSSSTSSGLDKNKVLSNGSKGAEVEELQKILNKALLDGPATIKPYLIEDGIFGAKTEERLMYFTNKKSISINQLVTELAKK